MAKRMFLKFGQIKTDGLQIRAVIVKDVVREYAEAEREALELMRADKHLSARTRAEEILRRDPDSIAGHFGLFGFEQSYLDEVDANLGELLATT